MCVTVFGSQMFSFSLTNTSASQQPLHDIAEHWHKGHVYTAFYCVTDVLHSNADVVCSASHTDTNESIHLLVIPGSPTACCWLWVSGGTPRRLGRPTGKAVCLLGLRCFQDCLDELQQLGGRNLPVDARLVKFHEHLHCSFLHHHL